MDRNEEQDTEGVAEAIIMLFAMTVTVNQREDELVGR